MLTNLPFKGAGIEITSHGLTSVLSTDAGITLSFDHWYSAALGIPADYQTQVKGLCGNFNGNKSDDNILSNDNNDIILSKDNATTGNYWKGPNIFWDINISCTTNFSNCPPCLYSKRELLSREEYCGFLIKPNGPLSPCYDKIPPLEYFKNCKKDLCDIESEEKRKEMLCKIIQNYVLICQAARVNIFQWRNGTFCSKLSHLPFTTSSLLSSPTGHMYAYQTLAISLLKAKGWGISSMV